MRSLLIVPSAVLLLSGCAGSTSFVPVEVQKSQIPPHLKEPFPALPPFQTGTFEEMSRYSALDSLLYSGCVDRYSELLDYAVRREKADK